MLNEDLDNPKPPEWLEKLESSRNRDHRLAHDVGSGSPCLKCLNDCKGLDLHFWRKICRNCKCTKDDHDVKDDGLDIHFNIVFGQKPFTYNQSRLKISLKNPESNDKSEKEVQLAWIPPSSSTKAAERFVKSFPENRIPIVGSTGASHRVRQLKKQLPIHDFDPSYCHDLNADEKKRLEEYSSHSRSFALGQGEVVLASAKPLNHQPDLIRSRLQYGTLVNINNSDGFISPSDSNDLHKSASSVNDTNTNLSDNLPAALKNLVLNDIEKLNNSNSGSNLGSNNMLSGVPPAGNLNITSAGGKIGSDNSGIEISPTGNLNSNTGGRFGSNNLIPGISTTGNFNNSIVAEDNFGSSNLFRAISPVGNVSAGESVGSSSLLRGISPTGNSNAGESFRSSNLLHGISPIGNSNAGDSFRSSNLLREISPTGNLINSNAEGKFGSNNLISGSPSENVNIAKAGRNIGANNAKSGLFPASASLVDSESNASSASLEGNRDTPSPQSMKIVDDRLSPEYKQTDGEGNATTVKHVSGAACTNCDQAITVDEVAVIIRTKQGLKYWHPNCFVCNSCQEFLVDLIYFMKDGKIFCGRDYAKECNIPRCFACDELIFSNEYTMAEMKTYHVRHFCCFECDQSLANQEYIVKLGNPVCLPCFKIKYAKICSSCGNKIGAHESGIDVNNVSWHANAKCFTCKSCSKSLLQTKFVLKHNFPFCSKDCYLIWNDSHSGEVMS